MKTVFKWILEPETAIDMPVGAEILCVQPQHGDVVLWAMVDTEVIATETRRFSAYGTGHRVKGNNQKYIGTAQLNRGSLVFHVFENLEEP